MLASGGGARRRILGQEGRHGANGSPGKGGGAGEGRRADSGACISGRDTAVSTILASTIARVGCVRVNIPFPETAFTVCHQSQCPAQASVSGRKRLPACMLTVPSCM